MKKRNIKSLTSRRIHDDILPLIALNATEIEELDVSIQGVLIDLTFVSQLKNLKLLQINTTINEIFIMPLLRELSVCTKLEILGISNLLNIYDEELLDVLSNITNLKQIRLQRVGIEISVNTSIEVLVGKLSKLESIMFMDCFSMNHRKFLELLCNSDKLRKIYVWENNIRSRSSESIEEIIKDFIGESHHSCFVSGNPLCIYLENKLFNAMKIWLTQENVKSIEKYGNIKIFQASRDDFSMFPSCMSACMD